MELKASFSYGWKFVLGVALIVYVGSLVDWADVYAKFSSMRPIYIVFGVLIVLMQAMVLGLRWQRIGQLDRIEIPVRPHVTATLISFFFSQGLPASIGADAFRVWWYARRGVNAAQGLKIIAFDRIIGIVSLAAVCAAGVVVLASRAEGTGVVAPLGMIIAAALGGFVALVLPFRTGMTAFLSDLRHKLPPTTGQILSWLIDMREFFRVGSRSNLSVILTFGVIVHLLTVLLGFVLARGLGADVGFWACLAAIAPALLVSYVPISIAGWGVREVSLVFAFGFVGVDRETALLVSLGIGTIVLAVSIFGGVLWMASGMRRSYRAR